MRGKSHLLLGHYLIDHYLSPLPRRYHRAFLLGCIEPDRNPMTYLKGSFRCQWLRGHHFPNAQPFMTRISHRLERKKTLNLFDYYTLGKLIHYTADAFTFAHNDNFPDILSLHQAYEARFQSYFLTYLRNAPRLKVHPSGSVMNVILSCHREYSGCRADIDRDSHFVLHTCCFVIAIVIQKI